ncbi:MAG TPA: DUF4921 family protein [Pirellulaceae bacterium]|nr:DUF4921 family protein [Pirellulaceae bacterium]
MSDIRYDPVFDQWVVIAENRRERPVEFVPIEQVRKPLICPFCVGNEDETPGAVLVLDEDGQELPPREASAWLVRVIPNKFPTFESSVRQRQESGGPYGTQIGRGLQEVIIPSPRHVISLSDLQDIELLVALLAAQRRMAAWIPLQTISHAMFFKNCRSEAGASIEHVHFQLIGSPLVSPALARRSERLAEHRAQHGCSMLEAIVAYEMEQQVRMVSESKRWVAFCPFASRQAFQIWLVPRNSTSSFCESSSDMLQELVELSQSYITRIESLFGQPGYNWMVHQLPFNQTESDHWFVEIFPRLAKTAGYEMGTDIWVNAVSPELAARRLR